MTRVLPVIGVFCVAGGLYLSFASIGTMLDARRSERWPTVVGQMESVKVFQIPPDPEMDNLDDLIRPWRVHIDYRYTVDGTDYRGHRGSFDERSREYEEAEAQAVAERYRASKQVTVHYEPGDPSNSVLRPGPRPASQRTPYAWLVTVALGLFLLLDRWRTTRLRLTVAVASAMAVAVVELLLFG